MAKNNKPASKPAIKSASAPAAPTATATPVGGRKGSAVLIKKTASQLHDLIGDAPIGVSHKELKAIVLKQRGADILAKAGI